MTASLMVALSAMFGSGALVAAATRRRMQRRVARARARQRRSVMAPSSARHSLIKFVDAVDRRRTRRDRRSLPGTVAALLDQIARHCSSGESIGVAFAGAAEGSPLAATFEPVVAALRTGETMRATLERLSIVHPDIAVAVHVLRLCAAQGGNVSESLDRAATTLREREAVAQERLAHGAQAQLSARVLTALPVAFGGWTFVTTPSVQRFFLTPAGAVCLLCGLTSNALGWLIMSRPRRGVA